MWSNHDARCLRRDPAGVGSWGRPRLVEVRGTVRGKSVVGLVDPSRLCFVRGIAYDDRSLVVVPGCDGPLFDGAAQHGDLRRKRTGEDPETCHRQEEAEKKAMHDLTPYGRATSVSVTVRVWSATTPAAAVALT